MRAIRISMTVGAVIASATTFAAADVVTIDYTQDAGGSNGNDLNGMSAQAIFEAAGTTLHVTLTNTSTGAPVGAEASDALLVSVGFNLPDGVEILNGVSALIAAGSEGIGAWDALVAGDSVADEWLWTNDGGGDLMAPLNQIISTSSGQGGGKRTDFNGDKAKVNGPYGGIAGAPPAVDIPGSQRAVSHSIEFEMIMSDFITLEELETMAAGSMVEFGSDFQYLAVPGPGGLALLGLVLVGRSRRRH